MINLVCYTLILSFHTQLVFSTLPAQAHADTVQRDARPLCPSCLCNICSSWCTSAREKPTPPLSWQLVRRVVERGWKGEAAVWVEKEGAGWTGTEVKTEAGAGKEKKKEKKSGHLNKKKEKDAKKRTIDNGRDKATGRTETKQLKKMDQHQRLFTSWVPLSKPFLPV